MSLQTKLNTLKRLLLINFLVSIFLTFLGIGLSTHYFSSKQSASEKYNQVTEDLQTCLTSMHLISALWTTPAPGGSQGTKQELFAHWKMLTELKAQLKSLRDENLTQLLDADEDQLVLKMGVVHRFVQKRSLDLVADLGEIKNQLFDERAMLIAVGLGTLVFGLLLPLVIAGFLKRKVLVVKKQLETNMESLLENWLKIQERWGPDAYQKAEFWLLIVLFTVERLGGVSNHFGVQSAGELAGIIRKQWDHKTKASS